MGHPSQEARAATQNRQTAGGYQGLQPDDKFQHPRPTRHRQHHEAVIQD